MKIIKELTLIFVGVMSMITGLALILQADLLNSIILLGIILIGIGGSVFGYMIKIEMEKR